MKKVFLNNIIPINKHVFFLLLLPLFAIGQKAHQGDSLSLVELYQQTDGAHWQNTSNWLTSNKLSSWYGVHLQTSTDDIVEGKGEAIPSIDLSLHVSDASTLSSQIVWTATSQVPVSATITGSRLSLQVMDVDWTGNSIVTVIATDRQGLRDTATFQSDGKHPDVL